MITDYSLLMGILSCTSFIFLIHVLRRSRAFLRSVQAHVILLLYFICVCRLLLPLELPFTAPVGLKNWYSHIVRFLTADRLVIGATQWSILKVACLIWITGAVLLLAGFAVGYFSRLQKLLFHSVEPQDIVGEAARKILREMQAGFAVSVRLSPETQVPMSVGVFRKYIFLPTREYTEEQVYFVLKHEYCHFRRRDQLTKIFVHMFKCAFWWNPAFYILQRDVSEILEMECDLAVTSGLESSQKERYLSVLLELVKDSKEKQKGSLPAAVQLFEHRPHGSLENLVERFELLSLQTRKAKGVLPAVLAAFCVFTVVLSYSVVLLPVFEPPRDEIVADGSDYEVILSGDLSALGMGETFWMDLHGCDTAVEVCIATGRDTESVPPPIDPRNERKTRVHAGKLEYRRWDTAHGCWLDPQWQTE